MKYACNNQNSPAFLAEPKVQNWQVKKHLSSYQKVRECALLGPFIGVGICLLFFTFCLYFYLDMQNALTKLRIEVPKLVSELRHIQEENVRLKYSVEEFKNPQHLLQLARGSDFSHLRFPLLKEVITLQAEPIVDPSRRKLESLSIHPHIAIASRQP